MFETNVAKIFHVEYWKEESIERTLVFYSGSLSLGLSTDVCVHVCVHVLVRGRYKDQGSTMREKKEEKTIRAHTGPRLCCIPSS